MGRRGKAWAGERSEEVFTTEDDRLITATGQSAKKTQDRTKLRFASESPLQTWSWGLHPASEAGGVLARQVAWTHGSWAWDTQELGWGCTGPGLTPAE